MFSRLFRSYSKSYRGLSTDIWFFSLIAFINRSGAMVFPFLAVYLTEALDFSVQEAGLVLMVFGLGSIAGSYVGGLLTDRYGHFWVQIVSLLLSAILFWLLVYLKTLIGFCIGIFITTMVVDAFRPASGAAIAAYSKPENLTRSIGLYRLALNLGFSFGPALGGFLAAIDYTLIFWIDGLTCLMAGVTFYFIFRNKDRKSEDPATSKADSPKPIPVKSAYQDWNFLTYLGVAFLVIVSFFQFFMTLPLYYREIYHLEEWVIGILLSTNGVIIVLVEMPLIGLLENRFRLMTILALGAFLVTLGFWILLVFHSPVILFISVALLTFGEIASFPFMHSLVIRYAPPRKQGQYLALQTMAFSLAHIISPAIGTSVIAHFGYEPLWILIGIIALLAAMAFYGMGKSRNKMAVLSTEEEQPQVKV